MWCPRCKSSRIQRGYNDSLIVLRLAGLHELLCNNCGLEFRGFDPLRKTSKSAIKRKQFDTNQRRFPRYQAHLPATIALVERDAVSWDVSYTHSTRGHCDTISQIGLGVSFVGSRFPTEKLTQPGCSLFVTVELPQGAIAGIVSVVYTEKTGSNGRGGWFVGTTISQMSERDAARLAAYIEKRANVDIYGTLG